MTKTSTTLQEVSFGPGETDDHTHVWATIQYDTKTGQEPIGTFASITVDLSIPNKTTVGDLPKLIEKAAKQRVTDLAKASPMELFSGDPEG